MHWKKWLAFLLASALTLCYVLPVQAAGDEHFEMNDSLSSVCSGEIGDGEAPEPPTTAPPAPTEPAPTEPAQPPVIEDTEPEQPSEPGGDEPESPSEDETEMPEETEPEETIPGDEPETTPSEQETDSWKPVEPDRDNGIRDYSGRVLDSSDGGRNQRFSAKDLEMEIPILISGNGHFVTIDKVPAAARSSLHVKEGMSDHAMNVGHLDAGGLLFILEEPNLEDGTDSEWYFIESGDVRGFLRREDVILSSDMSAKEMAKMRTAKPARPLKTYRENHVYTYSMKTTNPTMIPCEYATALKKTLILSDMSSDAEKVGRMKRGDLCYVIQKVNSNWIYVESDTVRGFVAALDLETGDSLNMKVMRKGESAYRKAETLVEKNQNAAYCYTMTSPVPGIISGDKKANLLENLNDYEDSDQVPGVRKDDRIHMGQVIEKLYAPFGYETGNTLKKLEKSGRVLGRMADLQTGDIVVYQSSDKKEEGDNLGIYLTEDEVLVCKKDGSAMKKTKLNMDKVDKFIRFFEDYQTQMIGAGIAEVNADPDMYGQNLGVFKLTFYCPCRRCNGPFANAITSTGKTAEEGRTIAVDPRIIPYGTRVIIGGHIFTAEDCGGDIKGNRIDVFVNNHQVGDALGVQYANVFVCK